MTKEFSKLKGLLDENLVNIHKYDKCGVFKVLASIILTLIMIVLILNSSKNSSKAYNFCIILSFMLSVNLFASYALERHEIIDIIILICNNIISALSFIRPNMGFAEIVFYSFSIMIIYMACLLYLVFTNKMATLYLCGIVSLFFIYLINPFKYINSLRMTSVNISICLFSYIFIALATGIITICCLCTIDTVIENIHKISINSLLSNNKCNICDKNK